MTSSWRPLGLSRNRWCRRVCRFFTTPDHLKTPQDGEHRRTGTGCNRSVRMTVRERGRWDRRGLARSRWEPIEAHCAGRSTAWRGKIREQLQYNREHAIARENLLNAAEAKLSAAQRRGAVEPIGGGLGHGESRAEAQPPGNPSSHHGQ